MRQIDRKLLLEQLIPVIQKAGEAIMKIYRQELTSIHPKEDGSPLTEADLAAHQVLADELPFLLPGCPVVSEEDAESEIYRRNRGMFWLIDPLDGTKEFIARNGEFTVNIALIKDGLSILGVVYAPAIDELYFGGADLGAFRRVASQTSPIKVSDAKHVDDGCRVIASKSHMNDATKAFIERLGSTNIVQAGSSLKFCRVAEGGADIYPRLSPTCEWDTAAAQAVLEGAGGLVVDLQDIPLQYGKPDVLNPYFIATRDRALIPT